MKGTRKQQTSKNCAAMMAEAQQQELNHATGGGLGGIINQLAKDPDQTLGYLQVIAHHPDYVDATPEKKLGIVSKLVKIIFGSSRGDD